LATDQKVRLFGHSLFFGSNRRLGLLFSHVSDLLTAEISDDSDEESDVDIGNTNHFTTAIERRERRQVKLGKHGIELKPCQHIFCGVSLLAMSQDFQLNCA
jgi:hypothetical protein